MKEDEPKNVLFKFGCAVLPFVGISVIPYAPFLIATGAAIVNTKNGKPQPIYQKSELSTLFAIDTLRAAIGVLLIANTLKHMEL